MTQANVHHRPSSTIGRIAARARQYRALTLAPWLVVLLLPTPAAADLPAGAADRQSIVDCLLPGQMRRIGSLLTLAPRRFVEVSAETCEQRGGEYVLYDRADPATALKLWMDAAERGDADAQNRVGQIYQMGIGTNADAVEAVRWFRKAAAQGHRAAALNLAAALETGNGAPPDPDEARRLYALAKSDAPTAPAALTPPPPTLTERLQAANQRIAELERAVQQSDEQRAEREAELVDARKQADQLLADPQVDAADVLAPPESRQAPRIELLDPNLIRTRSVGTVPVRADLTVKDLVGRVRSGGDTPPTLTVNGRTAPLDRFGFFATTLNLPPQGTDVHLVADSNGLSDALQFHLTPTARAARDTLPPLDFDGLALPGRRVALVIGNDHYQRWPSLETAVHDARVVAEVLQTRYGFEPRLLIDANYDTTLNTLNDLTQTLQPDDQLIIYYAGHGMLDTANLRGHWVPVDGDISRDSRWIPSFRITDLMNRIRARKILVVSDSCYSGAFIAAPGTVPGVPPSLSDSLRQRAASELARIPSRTMLTSGFLSPVLDGGGDGHSVFARAFIDVLRENQGPLDGYSLHSAVETRVLRAVKAERFDQSPVYAAVEHAGHQGGDFFLLPTGQ